MTVLIKTLAIVAAGTVLATVAYAQNAKKPMHNTLTSRHRHPRRLQFEPAYHSKEVTAMR